MADLIAMFSRWAKSALSAMFNRLSYSSLDGSSSSSSYLDGSYSSSSVEPTRPSAVDDFQRIMRMLPRTEAVLRDAEERDIQDTSVNLWLSELRVLAYDMDDAVDEYEYEVLRAQMQAKSKAEAYHRGKRKRVSDDHHDEDEWGEGRNVIESSSSQVPSILHGMAEKLRKIRKRFDEIESDRKALQLREEDGERRSVTAWRPLPTGSLVDETSIIGREGDKDKIMKLLLSNLEHSNCIQVSNKIEVIPIVGMGGVGKTTLAQCIYNDPRICQYFDLRGWIYVSEDFDLVRLTKELYRSITNKPCEEDVGLDHLQGSIKKELMQFKRTFLVLDDVWNELQCLWQSFQAPFHGAGIVTILMTTRNEKVANIMRTTNSFSLGFLSKEEGWQLFRQYALCDDENLLKIGKRIVRKCGGLPLAIKLLGSHLQFERDEDKWMSILESELWELDPGVSEILPALRLSYQRMPSHLKPCFRYCSMFPKNGYLDKDRLVWLWVAQGYIQAKTINKTVEETAREYFDELLGRSFIQEVENWPNSFKMHDLIFDLAVSISSNEFIKTIMEDGKQYKTISNNIRHLVIYDESTHNGAEVGTLLHPFLSIHSALRSIFYNVQRIKNNFQLLDQLRLRVLHLNIQKWDLNMSMFQVLIPPLKHLRYIYVRDKFPGFRGTELLRLFNSFQGMYNLQVLDLSHCRKPLILQASISDLINLRHLILPEGSFMPCGVSKLTSLQTLKKVIVKDGSHKCGGLSELEDLESLTGSCRIYEINLATDVRGVKKANINKKIHIWRLCLDWKRDDYDRISYDVDISFANPGREKTQRSELAEAMLEALRPHNDLKELEIRNYPGIRFPLWFGDPSYLPCPQSIFFCDCTKLYLLRNLCVQGCHELSTLRGLCNLHVLESLKLERCYNLSISAEERLPSKLRFVCFSDCRNLTSMTGLHDLHFLEKLELELCPKLQFSLDENFSILPGNVRVIDCPGLREWCQRYGFEFNQKVSQIKELTFYKFKDIESIYGSANLVSLKTLSICDRESDFFENESMPCSLNALYLSSCERLKFFPPYQNLSTLRLLTIWRCMALTYLPGLQMMKSLEKLEIMNCPEFTLSPVQRLPSKLQYLHISNCPRLMWLPGLQQLFSLRDLRLCECRELMLLPPEQLPFMHQVQLEIINCPKLANWCRRYNLSYNKKEFPKVLFARSGQQINSWLEEEESVFFENMCVLDYDEDKFKTGKWSAFRLLGLYIYSSVHLKTIEFSPDFTRLKQLRIWNCFHLEEIFGLDFYLTSLQDLDISNCPKLRFEKFPELFRFPALRYLKISKCPEVSTHTPWPHFRRTHVEIIACPRLQEWCLENQIPYSQEASQIKELRLAELEDIESRYGSANLVSLKTLYICNAISDFPENECIPCSLNALHILSCERLKFFPPYQNLSTLRLLKIWSCMALTYLPGLQMMKSLEKLEIMNCPQFTLSPVQRFPSKLQYLDIINCPRLMWLPGLQQLFSLRDLRLCECRELMLLPPEQLPFMHQVHLEIINCPKLANWCRKHNLSYNKKESPKDLIARSSQEIYSWLEEEESVLFENICVLDYDKNINETIRWPAFRLLGFYVCFCVLLKSIHFSKNFDRLKQLRLWNCSHLKDLFGLHDLTALEDMDISNCPELFYLGYGLFDRRYCPSFRFLKISKCPKVYLDYDLLPYPPTEVPEIEIRACPLLQRWCQKYHIEYFKD